VYVESSGKIIVIGNKYQDAFSRFAVYRFNSNGSQDTHFMTTADEPVTVDVDTSGILDDNAQSALISSSGDLIIGGNTDDDTTFALAAMTLQSCGDGNTDGSEECDDGNTSDNDTCTTSCLTQAWYCFDSDSDGHGNNSHVCSYMTATDARVTSGEYVSNDDDCNDFEGEGESIYPGATETCGDGIDQDCDGADTTCSAVEVLTTTLDSDGDGVLDPDDAFSNDHMESVDTDGDGTGNNADTDDDGDGVDDSADAFPMDSAESVDTDADGIGNNADTDDDGDGVDDSTVAPAALDSDGDGVVDSEDAFPNDATESVDTDADGTGNAADTDDDGDGVDDSADAFPMDSAESVDTDDDGTGNTADADADGDGTNDDVDDDDDGDGIVDTVDDSDGDGVVDAEDAFPNNANAATDADDDGVVDQVESDPEGDDSDDDDGVVDQVESVPEDEENDNDDVDGTDDVDESESADDAATAKSTGCGCSFTAQNPNAVYQNGIMAFVVLWVGLAFVKLRQRSRVE
jgi:cysteine-rich repeat protein